MIEPPTLHTEERQEYDIMDLELLGKIAVELSVHSHPTVKRSFERLVETVGTKRFAEDYCALQKFLMKLHQQVQLTNEFSYCHSGSPSFSWSLPNTNGEATGQTQNTPSSTPQNFVNFSFSPADSHHQRKSPTSNMGKLGPKAPLPPPTPPEPQHHVTITNNSSSLNTNNEDLEMSAKSNNSIQFQTPLRGYIPSGCLSGRPGSLGLRRWRSGSAIPGSNNLMTKPQSSLLGLPFESPAALPSNRKTITPHGMIGSMETSHPSHKSSPFSLSSSPSFWASLTSKASVINTTDSPDGAPPNALEASLRDATSNAKRGRKSLPPTTPKPSISS